MEKVGGEVGNVGLDVYRVYRIVIKNLKFFFLWLGVIEEFWVGRWCIWISNLEGFIRKLFGERIGGW